jgi:hypothetical protein
MKLRRYLNSIPSGVSLDGCLRHIASSFLTAHFLTGGTGKFLLRSSCSRWPRFAMDRPTWEIILARTTTMPRVRKFAVVGSAEEPSSLDCEER